MNGIQRRRKKLKITREALAANAGVSLSTVIRHENIEPYEGSNLARNAIEAALDRLESQRKETA